MDISFNGLSHCAEVYGKNRQFSVTGGWKIINDASSSSFNIYYKDTLIADYHDNEGFNDHIDLSDVKMKRLMHIICIKMPDLIEKCTNIKENAQEKEKTIMKRYADNIDWSIDIEEAYEKLDDMDVQKASEFFEIPYEQYSNMTTNERHDYAYSAFHHCPAKLDEFMELPSQVEIPEELKDDEDITNWLSDLFGYCINGYDIIKHVEKQETIKEAVYVNENIPEELDSEEPDLDR